jgi:membrane-associated phospholipid phosphatase
VRLDAVSYDERNPRGSMRLISFRTNHFSVYRFFVLSLCLALPTLAKSQTISASLPDAPIPTAEAQRASSPSVEDIDISWKKLPRRFLEDQKIIWLFPTQLARGHYWVPTLFVVGGTAALIATDPKTAPYFRKHGGNLDDLNDTVDGTITSAGTAAIPLSLLAAGYIRHDSYQVNTSLLAGEAYADSAIVDLALKIITARKRPNAIPPSGPFSDTFFNHGGSRLSAGSFPSGHAIGAFSIATVIANRYHQHRWVPIAVYGFATAVSLSRITTSAHFPSDVFLGASLGYVIARFDVLRH